MSVNEVINISGYVVSHHYEHTSCMQGKLNGSSEHEVDSPKVLSDIAK
jgi:hypothetical protein